MASNCVWPCAPAPMMAATDASARAIKSVATPEAAPVRRAVTDAPSMTAKGTPVVPSESTTRAEMVGRPRSTLDGKTETTFTAMAPDCGE